MRSRISTFPASAHHHHHRGPASHRTSVCVSVLASLLLVADGTLVLYATLLWPPPPSDADGPIGPIGPIDPLLVVGVVTFVVCFTLPFVLVVALMVSAVEGIFCGENQVENRGECHAEMGCGNNMLVKVLRPP